MYASSGEMEVPGFYDGARSRDLVEALSEDEEQRFNIRNWLKWSVAQAAASGVHAVVKHIWLPDVVKIQSKSAVYSCSLLTFC